MKLRTKEYFAGTGSFSSVAKNRGHSICRFELETSFDAEIHGDILDVKKEKNYFDVAWFSPVCTGFSVAAIGKNWDKVLRTPKTETAKHGIAMLRKSIELISQGKYTYWFIENPRGMMRKVIDNLFVEFGIKNVHHATICYCRYGDSRMKPTDIWHNSSWSPECYTEKEQKEMGVLKGRMCFNGCCDHESAPRGSKTGTQGLSGSVERSIIPSELFEEIFDCLEFDFDLF